MTDDFDDERELCPDDTCVGLIGADGRCKECGAIAEDQPGDAEPAAEPSEPEPDIEPARDPDPELAGFDDDRALCPDGSCIGLVGDDGRCKECGRDARAA